MAARLAFIGLWVEADDYGRLKAKPVRLKARIFPYDRMTPAKFTSILAELESVGCIKGSIGNLAIFSWKNFSIRTNFRFRFFLLQTAFSFAMMFLIIRHCRNEMIV